MPTSRRSLSVPERWRDWRQRLRGDQDELLDVLANLTMPQKRTPEEVDQRVSRAEALCDAALFMLWLAGIGSPEAGRRLQQREVNLIDLRPADVVTFVGSLTANGVVDEALSGLTRREFDQCWHTEASFRMDLMAYLFRPEVYLERAFQAQEDVRDLMLSMDDFSEFVEAAAAREVRSATSDPVVALGSLVGASLPRDTHIQRLVAAVNRQSRASWTALYQEALERYGKRLNDGLKVEDFTRMAAMLTEGALAHSRSDPADVTSADMLAGVQLIVNAFIARTDALADNGAAMADAATLDQYRRHLVLNEKLTADERTLRILQQAHLDAFAYCNLDVMLGDAFLDLPNYLSRLMNSRHGGLCYQLNYSLALVLRAVGFNIDYLWGTVSKERGQPGNPPGNHLGLLVTIGERKWLADAGLGDGPREPILLIPGPVQQGPFQYELIEEPTTWTLVHDKQGTFAEVTFSKKPVKMDAFRSPADEQLTGPDSGFLHTLAVMKRRKDEAHLLRGRVYEVTGEHCPPARIVASQQEWLELLGSQFGVYLGNISESQQRNLWEKVCESHERWIENQGTEPS
jgi:N-hydroxyarylamine O-acetyltransferase